MNTPLQGLVERLLRARIAMAGMLALASLAGASTLPGLQVSNSMEAWFPEQDAALRQYRDFRRDWGSDEIVVVAVTDVAGFSGDTDAIADLTHRLLDIAGVATVTSRATVPQSLRDAQDRLLSDDGQTTALLVQLLDADDIDQRRQQILTEIDSAIAEFGWHARLAGYGVIYAALNEASTTGAATTLLAAHVLMFSVLLCLLRSIRAALSTLLTVTVASILTLAVFVSSGEQLNMITMALPTLVLVIGIANCVHVIRSVQREAAPRQLVNGIAAVIVPCSVASVTTAAGFLVLAVSDIAAIRSLGLFAALGMLISLLCVFALLPALLYWFPPRRIDGPDRPAQLALHLCRIAQLRPVATLAAFCALALVAAIGMTRLEFDTYSIAYLKDNHRVRQDSDFIESRLGPYAPIDFVVSSKKSVLQPAVLDALQSWQQELVSSGEVAWSWSLLDALGVPADRAPSSMPSGWLRLRLARLNRMAPVTMGAMIRGDRQLRVSFGAPQVSAKKLARIIEHIDALASFGDDVTVRAAGYLPLYTRIVDELVGSQIRSFSLALMLVLSLFALAVRCTKRVLLSVPANLLPVFLTLGLMGLCGIPLDVATVTIASIIFGLVVDDTVHMLHPTGTERQSLSESLMRSVEQRGGSLLVTSVVLAAGFMVFGLAEIRSIAWFGLLICFALVSAIVADLMLLPALARVSCPKVNGAALRGNVS